MTFGSLGSGHHTIDSKPLYHDSTAWGGISLGAAYDTRIAGLGQVLYRVQWGDPWMTVPRAHFSSLPIMIAYG